MRVALALRRLATAGAALTLGAGLGLSLAPLQAAAATTPQLVPASCATANPGHAHCLAVQLANPGAVPSSAMSASALQKAYGVAGLKSGGVTVAIVDAFNDPGLEKDLNDYRSANGLGSCTKASGCLTVVGQDGSSTLPTQTDSGWATEMAIDVDAVSALCPDCKILMVEGNTNDDTDLAIAVDSAVKLGAKIVSNSYADHESAIPSGVDSHYNHPGVAILGATGDWGSETGTQAEYPATSPEVVAVGGTSLTTSSNSRGYAETAWNKTGSGCSSIFAKPSYQTNDTTCGDKRGESDISADADPNTGITIYVNGAQSQYGGTSLATPIVAGIWALAGVPNSNDNPAAYPYAHTGNFFDVTSGSNGSCGTIICNAGTGWDGPTGWGTPNGVAGLQPAGPAGAPTVQNPGDQTVTVGQSVNLQIHVSGGTSPFGYAADTLPAGLAIDKSTGVISGKPTTTGSTKTTVTVTDSAGKTGSTTFNWTVNQAGQLTVANPGDQTGTVGKSASLQINASGGTSPYGYAAKGLPAGLSIDSKSGLISGTPTTAGSNPVVITVTDSTGASGQTNFTWTVNPAPASPLSATFSTDYDYGWGAFTHFTITNNGTTAVNSWSLAFDVPSNESLQITNPGTASGSTGHVVVTGNYQIPPGGSITVNQTYQVNSGSFTPPTNVVVTGS